MRNMMLQEKSYNRFALLLRRVGVALLLLVGAVGTASAWEICGTNLQYEIDGSGVLRFQSPSPTASASVDASAFLNRTEITDIIFPDNLTEINSEAFRGCTSLTDIVLPSSLTSIGVEAFYGCSALTSVLCRPFTAPSLGNDAFTNCASGLQICVPNLGSYKNTDFWGDYELILTFCYFLDEYDEQAAATTKISSFRSASIADVDIFRTLRKAGSFNTLTLPFNVPDISASPLAGAEVYEFSNATVENGELQLEITPLAGPGLVAGTPYLIQWPNTGEVLNRMTFTGITWDDDQEANTVQSIGVDYVGFYGRKHIDDDANHSNLFLKGNNTLYWPAEGDVSSMLGFRAYFHVNTSSASPAPIYHGMPAALRIKSTTTDIESVQTDNAPRKELRNGQLVIIRNGETFSLNGQKL